MEYRNATLHWLNQFDIQYLSQFTVVVLYVGFHVVTSVVFVTTVLTLKQLDCAVNCVHMSVQFDFLCKNFVTFLTFHFHCCLISCQL